MAQHQSTDSSTSQPVLDLSSVPIDITSIENARRFIDLLNGNIAFVAQKDEASASDSSTTVAKSTTHPGRFYVRCIDDAGNLSFVARDSFAGECANRIIRGPDGVVTSVSFDEAVRLFVNWSYNPEMQNFLQQCVNIEREKREAGPHWLERGIARTTRQRAVIDRRLIEPFWSYIDSWCSISDSGVDRVSYSSLNSYINGWFASLFQRISSTFMSAPIIIDYNEYPDPSSPLISSKFIRSIGQLLGENGYVEYTADQFLELIKNNPMGNQFESYRLVHVCGALPATICLSAILARLINPEHATDADRTRFIFTQRPGTDIAQYDVMGRRCYFVICAYDSRYAVDKTRRPSQRVCQYLEKLKDPIALKHFSAYLRDYNLTHFIMKDIPSIVPAGVIQRERARQPARFLSDIVTYQIDHMLDMYTDHTQFTQIIAQCALPYERDQRIKREHLYRAYCTWCDVYSYELLPELDFYREVDKFVKVTHPNQEDPQSLDYVISVRNLREYFHDEQP